MQKNVDLGVLLFAIYFLLKFIFKISKQKTNYLALLSFVAVPLLLILKKETVAEVLSVFGFSLLIFTTLQTIPELRKDAHTTF